MSDVPILQPEQRWECPSCSFTDVTHIPGYVSHLHACTGQRLLMIPMVPAGTKSVHVIAPFEDYIGSKLIRRDAEGRPVTHINTIRDDGMDATVYPAPAAVAAIAGERE
jgi:hypothetical protein